MVVVVCVCVSVCVCYRASGYIPGLCVQSEVAYSFLWLLKVCIVWTLLETFHLGDTVSFACHDDWRLSSFSIKKSHQWLLMRLEIAQYILARSDD